MLVNIMVFILVLVEACFEPLSYNFFSKHRPIVNKKIRGIKKIAIFATNNFSSSKSIKIYLYETVQG